MKVLVVHNRYRSAQPSGENGVADDECRLLAAHGAEVERLEVESDEIAGWSPLRRAALPLRVVWSGRGAALVRDAVERADPDVVHFHNTFPLLSPAALTAASSGRAAVVQTLHNFRPLCPAATFLRNGRVCEDCLGRLPLPALRHGCYRGSRAATVPLVAMTVVHRGLATWERCVDRFVAPSAFLRDTYVRAGWDGGRIEIKHNTVPDPARRREGPGEGFVCVARLSSEKGVDSLLRAWPEAFPRGGERLTVVGSGDDEAALRELAAPLDGVELAGALPHDDVLERIGRARAVVIPSRCYEVFPRVLAEAYALGVPVVAARLGSLRELVRPGETGMLFDPDAPSGLAAALQALAESDPRSLALGAGARQAYEERLSPARLTAQLLGCYARAIEAKEREPRAVPATGVVSAPLG